MSENEIVPSTYDAVPYEGTHLLTHPFRLETSGTLFGMDVKPIGEARILELGCAQGENIIPMAASLPGATFIGMDLSQGQIDEGQRVVDAVGLDNIELRQADILDIDESWGQFDYIICHGVYSWVPAPVRDKALEVCKCNLAPDGVALVSYNVFPGWHMKRMIRDVVKFHTSQFEDPNEQIAGAKNILKFMAEMHSEDSIFGQILRGTIGDERGLLSPKNDFYLFHEFIETVNDPCLFFEFAEAAQGKGLQYMWDSNIFHSTSFSLPAKTVKALKNVPLIRKEQYRDFLFNRTFRSSLLCHADVQLDRNMSNAKAHNFHIAFARDFDKLEIDIRNRDVAKIPLSKGSLSVSDRAAKATIMCLKEVYPRFLPYEKLRETVLARLTACGKNAPGELDQAEDRIAAMVLTGHACALFEMSVSPPDWCLEVSERPKAGALTLFNASEGRNIANPLHRLIGFNPPNRYLLQHLNGERDHNELVRILAEAVRADQFSLTAKAQKDGVDAAAAHFVKAALNGIARSGLLVG
jgi:methyltransferase-like protein/ubiquinone/menaquinone biosynthesis C-methylase UbiE